MLHDRFANEADFRANFIRPLLTRMNFLAVAELHGNQEFGKDFVFSELTPFGFLRHHATVVKHERAINQTSHSLCFEVLAQINQAFSKEFTLPDSEEIHRVSSVFVFNSGKITDNARTWLRAQLTEEKYGRNVHVLDGERLFQLDLNSTFGRGADLLPRLQGLKHDINLNALVHKSIFDALPIFSEGRGSFSTAVENFVAAPYLAEHINVEKVGAYLQQIRIIDTINRRQLSAVHLPKDIRETELTTVRQIISDSTALAGELLDQITKAERSLQLLTSTMSQRTKQEI